METKSNNVFVIGLLTLIFGLVIGYFAGGAHIVPMRTIMSVCAEQ